MDELNEYQKKAAEYDGKHLLVLAGAGTGKTKTIIARAEYLIKSGIPPDKIVILSFTRKSAQEIAERIKTSVSGQFNASAISGRTFHSWCNEIMHIYPDYFPQSKYTLLDEDDRISAMGLAVGKYFKDSQGEKLNSKSIVSIYSYAVNTLTNLSNAIKHTRYFNSEKEDEELDAIVEKDKALIGPVIKKYIDYKLSRRYIDYDDMLNVVADALQNNQVIRRAITNRWKHILVDEMQDTNPLQYKLLKSFIYDSQLFCVGDDAQSIYAFRGADFKTIHSFTDIVPDSKAYRLLLNYRSTQEILDLSNWLLKQSPLNYNKELEAYRGNGRRPKIIHTENDWEEANIITDDIIQKVSKENLNYSDTMILGRSGWSLAKVEGACLQKKIPYRKLGGTSLMQSAHVRDVAAAMRVVANNYDEIAWIRFLKLWEGIGEVTATNIITDIISLVSFSKIIEYLENSNNKYLIKQIPETLRNVNEYINNPSSAMRAAVNTMSEILKKKYKKEWDYRINDFVVLEEVAKSTSSISEFITEYVLDPRAETTLKWGSNSNEDVVTLSTIHSAKGLESKIVHIIDVAPYNYPSTRSIAEGKDAIEEERRCLYVALTRAKDELKLYRNMKSIHIQSNDDCQDSEENSEEESLYFLNNLPCELVEIEVTENYREQQEIVTEKTDPAKLPDFDFD